VAFAGWPSDGNAALKADEPSDNGGRIRFSG